MRRNVLELSTLFQEDASKAFIWAECISKAENLESKLMRMSGQARD